MSDCTEHDDCDFVAPEKVGDCWQEHRCDICGTSWEDAVTHWLAGGD